MNKYSNNVIKNLYNVILTYIFIINKYNLRIFNNLQTNYLLNF